MVDPSGRKGLRAMWKIVLGGLVSMLAGQAALAADVGIGAKKLIVIDKLASAQKAKTVFVSKDPLVDKGPGTDVNGIGAIFDFFYGGDSGATAGEFVLAPGASNGTDGWVANKETVAKYVNKMAPGGATGAKVGVIKPGKVLKLVGKTLGDQPIDLVGAGAPVSDVCTVYSVTDDGQTIRHCTVFAAADVAFQVVGGGSGRKLVAKNGSPDVGCAVCAAGVPTTTSSSTTTSTPASTTTSTSATSSTTTTSVPGLCGNGVIDPGETCDDGNTDNADLCPSDCVIDACTPIVGGTLVSAVLSFQSPGVPIAGFKILIDYPEGKLDYASAVPLVSGFLPPQDYGHALLVIRAAASGIDSGPVLRTRYNACQGAPAATNADFGCEVLEAVDDATNLVDGVTCTVTLE
jgi:cysteine-rich repeat protein